MERQEATKYLETGKEESIKMRESCSLRRWSSQGRSSPTGEMEVHPSQTELYQAAQGSSNGPSHTKGP